MVKVGGIGADQLKSIVDRVEKLEEEKAALTKHIQEVYSEAKSHGFDSKIIRKVVSLRKMERDDFEEQEHMLDLYLRALGMRVESLEE